MVAGALTVAGPFGNDEQPALVPAATGAGSAVTAYAYVQTSNGGATYHLVTAGGNGCCHRQVTTFPVLGRPSFSPNGQQLAFSGPITNGSDGRYGIYVVNTNGTGLKRLTITQFADQDPAWSPDGRTIAFTRDTIGFGSGNIIGLVNSDGTSARAVSGSNGGYLPSWSPDSRSLAYAAPDGIRTIPVGGGASRLIDRGNDGDPAWSPDGQRIAFVRHVAEASDTVAVVGATGGTTVAIENVAGSAETPGWSADSTTVHWLDFLGEGEEGRTLTAVWKVQLGQSPTFVFSTPSPQLHLAVWAGTPTPPAPQPRAIVGIRSATDNTMLVRRQDASGFRSLGGNIISPPAIVSAGGIAYYFAESHTGELYGRTDSAAWSRVGPAGMTCATPAAAVVGSTVTIDCRNSSNKLITGTATLNGAVPTIPSFSVGGSIAGGPGLGVVSGKVTTATLGPTRSDGTNVVVSVAGGGQLAVPLFCSGPPTIAGWGPASAWIACVSRGALAFMHQHAPGQWAGRTTLGSGWVGAVGLATRPDGYASMYLQGSDRLIRLFDTRAFTTNSYGPAANGGAGGAEIVTR
jgi:hypothetical protein